MTRSAKHSTFLTLLTIIATSALNACGFTPMHGNLNANSQGSVGAKMAQVDVTRIPGRSGQILRNRLVERLQRGAANNIRTYTLHITSIAEQRTELDITETSDTTRTQLRLRTTLRLKRTGKDAAVLKRDIAATTSYNVLASQFTTRVSEQKARENAIRTLAERIERQLALHFSRQDDTQGAT